MTWKIPLFKIYWDGEDVKAGMNRATGPNVGKLELSEEEHVSKVKAKLKLLIFNKVERTFIDYV